MNSPNKVLNFCVFCLRDSRVSSFKTNSNLDIQYNFKIFHKVFGRFLKRDEKRNLEDITLTVSSFRYCEECLNITQKFCDVYHQYKCLKLQLEWIVWTIERIMRLANKVPSRVSRTKNIVQDINTNEPNEYEIIEHFRKEILQKCQLKLRRSNPRVCIQRIGAPTPVIDQPVSHDTSIVHFNNYSCLRTEKTENSDDNHFEDTTGDLDDVQVDHKITSIDTIIISDHSEPNKQPVLQNTTHTSVLDPVSAPCLAAENVVETLTICKKEPQTDERAYLEKNTKENNISCCSVSTTIPIREYNLRKKTPRNILQIDNDYNSDVGSMGGNPESSSNISRSSFSDTSSEEEDYDNKPNLSSLKRAKNKQNNDRIKQFKCMKCGSRKNKRRFENHEVYQNHLNLHSKGKFPCNFCSKVESSLIMLSSHEYKIHGDGKNQMFKRGNGWKCPRCPFKATYLTDYEFHFAYTHFSKGIEPLNRRVFANCKICNRNICNKFMDYHFKIWHDTTILKDRKIKRCTADRCLAYFMQDWQLQSHRRLEHNTKIRKPKPKIFQCFVCLKTFSQKLTLLRHKRQLHKNQLRINSKSNSKVIDKNTQQVGATEKYTQLFNCNFCHVVKENPSALALHEVDKHPRGSDQVSNPSSLKNSKQPNRCPRCPYVYLLKRAYIKHHLHVHLNLLNPDTPSACKLCSVGKVYKANSETHFRKFHQIDDDMEAKKCDKCPAYFRTPFQLQMHILRVHQQRDKCEICGTVMSSRLSLSFHMKTEHPANDENPDLPLACDFVAGCKKRFRTQGEIEYHQKYEHRKIRLGSVVKIASVRPKCDRCGQEFTGICYLEAHLVKVHGERPFVCDECGKAFKSKFGLDLHSDFHKRPEEWKWQCAECGKKCTTKQKLEEHGRTHTKEKPFVCQFCGEKYAHRHNWRNHLKMKHGDEEGVDKLIGKGRKGEYANRKGLKKGDRIMARK